MSSSLKSTRLQEIKAEILSLLNVLSDKVDLERKFGANYLQLSPIRKIYTSSEEDVISQQLTRKPHLDTHNERIKVELNKSEKIKELKKLEKQVKQCTKCELCKGRTNVVFGTGASDADLMFVGEAPGHYEDVQGEPFVGRAGQLLTRIIESIGMKRDEVYIANILKCRPPGEQKSQR